MKTKIFLFALISLFLFVSCGKNELPKPSVIIAEGEENYMILTGTEKSGATMKLDIKVSEFSPKDTSSVWIDFNGNGTPDDGEDDIAFGKTKEYAVSSKTIVVYGKITNFVCNGNELSQLDVSKNLSLQYLDCHQNQLSSLDVSKNLELVSLLCSNNQLSSLDVSKNSGLFALDILMNKIYGTEMDNLINSMPTCKYFGVCKVLDTSNPKEENIITGKQVAAAKGKRWLVVDNNNKLYPGEGVSPDPDPEPEPEPEPDPDLTHYIELKTDKSVGDSITLTINTKPADKKNVWIDLNNNGEKDAGEKAVIGKQAYKIGAQTIRVYGKVSTFFCDEIELTELDVTNNTALKRLDCMYNKLTKLDLSKNVALEELNCMSNFNLGKLNLNANTALKQLDCRRTGIKQLNLSVHKDLHSLYCSGNKLTTLDITNNKSLTTLFCAENELTALVLNKDIPLGILDIYDNRIKGQEMQKLVDGLRNWNATSKGKLLVFSPGDKEQNVITKAQVQLLKKTKNWRVLTVHQEDYPGQ